MVEHQSSLVCNLHKEWRMAWKMKGGRGGREGIGGGGG